MFDPISKRSIQIRGALTALALASAVTAAAILAPLTVGAQGAVSDPPVDTRMGPHGQAGPTGGQPDLAAAAATLGVAEEALESALGEPDQGPPDFTAAAATLGVSEEALMEALGLSADALPIGEQPANGQRPGGSQPPMGRP